MTSECSARKENTSIGFSNFMWLEGERGSKRYFICLNLKIKGIDLHRCFKCTNAKKKVKSRWNVCVGHTGAWNCMKNMLCQGTTCSNLQDSPFLGVHVALMSYSSPESLLLLRQQLVLGLWLNVFCLLVGHVLTYHMFRLPSSLLKMTFSGHIFSTEVFLLGHCPAVDHV